jgi:quaternary ammonium compound-resistance protein SugE
LAWVWLAVAGLCEIGWVVLLKASDGFTRLWPAAGTVLTVAVSFYCMAQALRALPMGTVYAVWTGIGAAGGVIWGIAAQGEPATAMRLLCVALIVAGVVGLKLGS